MMMRLSYFLFALFLLSPFSCFSSCSVVTSAYTIDVGNIVVPSNAPVGTEISGQIVGNNATAYSCANTYQGWGIGVKNQNVSSITIGTHPVFNTNIPGVGIELGGSASVTDDVSYTFSYSCYIFTTNCGGNMSSSSEYYQLITYMGGDRKGHEIIQPYITLVKTGPITSGALTGNLGYVVSANTAGVIASWNPDIPINGAGSISNISCSMTSTSSMSFPVGNVPVGEFTAVGTVSKKTSTRDLGLNCDAGANINVTLNGTQNPDSPDPSILALARGTNVATGVGVQLLYDGKPLELNKQLYLKTSAGGQETFPITARYIQTKGTVTPGTANATATLNITYQ